MFGSNNTSAPSSFGSSNQKPLNFSSNSQAGSASNTASNTATNTPLFGASAAAGNASSSGNPQTTNASGTGSTATSTPPAFSFPKTGAGFASSTSSAFGSAKPAFGSDSPFAAKPTADQEKSSASGSEATPAPSGGSLFKSSEMGASTSGSLFKSSEMGASTSGSLFKSSEMGASTSGGLFKPSETGASNSGGLFKPAETSGSLFKSVETGGSTSGGLFGGNASKPGSGLFAATTPKPLNTGSLFGKKTDTEESSQKPEDKSGQKPEDKSGQKPEDKSGQKPEDKSGQKPEAKANDAPIFSFDKKPQENSNNPVFSVPSTTEKSSNTPLFPFGQKNQEASNEKSKEQTPVGQNTENKAKEPAFSFGGSSDSKKPAFNFAVNSTEKNEKSAPLFGTSQEKNEVPSTKPDEKDKNSLFGAKPEEKNNLFGAKNEKKDNLFGAKPEEKNNLFGAKPEEKNNLFGAKPEEKNNLFGSKNEKDNLSDPKVSLKTDANAPNLKPTQVQPMAVSLDNKTMDDLVIKWSKQLTRTSDIFDKYTDKVQGWDEKLAKSADEISDLHRDSMEVDALQQRIDQQLTFVEGQQDELDKILDNYEQQAEILLNSIEMSNVENSGSSNGNNGAADTSNVTDKLREKAYHNAKLLDDRLDSLSDNLSSLVGEINAVSDSFNRALMNPFPASESGESNAVEEMVKLLNLHLNNLKYIESTKNVLEQKVVELKTQKMQKRLR